MMPSEKPRSRVKRTRSVSIGLFFVFATAGIAQSTNNPIFAARAEKAFRLAQAQLATSTNAAAAWQFARAAFDFADFATNDIQRADIARQGIAACEQLLTRETNSAPGFYYLAMNEGQLARAEAPSLAAYRLVRQMERAFATAADLDKNLDYAGPARCLGLLYRDAPGWPFSIGSRRKASDELELAAKLAPDYPENQLNLAETYLQWHELDKATNALKTLDALWPAARTNLTGVTWERSWDDWSTRRDAARKRSAQLSAPLKPPKAGE